MDASVKYTPCQLSLDARKQLAAAAKSLAKRVPEPKLPALIPFRRPKRRGFSPARSTRPKGRVAPATGHGAKCRNGVPLERIPQGGSETTSRIRELLAEQNIWEATLPRNRDERRLKRAVLYRIKNELAVLGE